MGIAMESITGRKDALISLYEKPIKTENAALLSQFSVPYKRHQLIVIRPSEVK